MKTIILNTKNVLPLLANVASVVSQKNSIPILDTIRMNTSLKDGANILEITASDGETWVTQYTNVDGDDGLDVCVNANDLLKGLRNLEEENVDFIADESDNSILCKYSNGYFKLVYEDSSNYPKHDIDLNESSAHNIDSSKLLSYISGVQYAVNNDTLRPIFNTIHFDFFEDNMVVVATDGQRLAKIKDCNVTCEKCESFNLPIKPANIIANILSMTKGDVQCVFNNTGISFSNNDFVLTTRLLEGKYPNYDSVIPTASNYKAVVAKQTIISAIKRVAPMGNATSELMKMSFNFSEIKVSAEILDFCKKGEETLECNYNGVKMDICFKSSYLLQTLQNMNCENVEINLIAPNRACILSPCEKEENVEFTYLLMPLLLD